MASLYSSLSDVSEQPASSASSPPPQQPGPAPVSDSESCTCGVCLGRITDNVQCTVCRNVFCRDCIYTWAKTSAAPSAASCPTCRRTDEKENLFVHNAELELVLGAAPYACEHRCGANITWGQRRAHLAVCDNAPVACPFLGCQASVPRGELDQHTFSCAFSRQYSGGTILARIAALSAEAASQDAAELYEAFLKEKPGLESARAQPSGTAVHYIQEHDTLAGIALRYGTSKEKIRQLNRLGSDNIFGHTSLLVPQPDGKQIEPPADPPAEVVLALHRRRLARQVIGCTQLPPEEAIAYLKLAHYNVANAVAQHRADSEWARSHAFKPARTLTEFLQQNEARARQSCHACAAVLDAKRQHCPRCGRVLCRACISGHGHFSKTLPRAVLGVTGPSKTAVVAVCNACAV